MGEHSDPERDRAQSRDGLRIPLSLARNIMLSTPWARVTTDAGATPAAGVPAAIFIAARMTDRASSAGTAARAAPGYSPAVKSPAAGATPRPISRRRSRARARDNRARTVPWAQPSRRAAAAVVRPSR